MSGFKCFPLGAVCGIKTPLWFAVLKPTTVTKKRKRKKKRRQTERKKTTFNLEGKMSTVWSPGSAEGNAAGGCEHPGLGFYTGTDLSALRHPWVVPLISSEC